MEQLAHIVHHVASLCSGGKAPVKVVERALAALRQPVDVAVNERRGSQQTVWQVTLLHIH